MAEITVNSEGLRSSAGVFEEVKKNIQTLLADIQNEMDHVKQNYKGEEADDLYNRFSQLSDDFEERGKVIQEYADIQELDSGMLNRLVRKIVVHEHIDSNQTRNFAS